MTQPEFHLCRIDHDGSRGPIQVFRVEDVPLSMRVSRRGFLGCGLSAGAILAAMSSGCDQGQPSAGVVSPSPPPPQPAANAPPATEEQPPFDPKVFFYAHLSAVSQLSMDARGSLLVSVGKGKTLERKVWRLPKGKLLGTAPCGAYDGPALPEAAPPVLELLDDKLTVSAGEPLTATAVRALAGPPARLAITRDGKLGVVWRGGERCCLELISLDRGEACGELDPPPSEAGHALGWEGVALSADGQRVTAGWKNRAIHVWSLGDRRLITTLSGAKLPPGTEEVVVSHAGELALVRTKVSVEVWSLVDRTKRLDLRSPRPEIVEFTEVTARLVPSPTVPVEEVSIKGSVSEPAIHFQEARFSPDDRHVLVRGTASAPWQVWSLPEARQVAEHTELGTLSSDGRWMAMLRQRDVAIHSFPSGALLTVLAGHQDTVRSVCFSGDGRLVAVGDDAGIITLWVLPEGTRTAYLNDPQATAQRWQNIHQDQKGVTYNVYDAQQGRNVTSTLPCGSPLPAGAVCTCNCVPGVATPARSCQCNPVCTCIPVRTPGRRVCTCIPVRIR